MLPSMQSGSLHSHRFTTALCHISRLRQGRLSDGTKPVRDHAGRLFVSLCSDTWGRIAELSRFSPQWRICLNGVILESTSMDRFGTDPESTQRSEVCLWMGLFVSAGT